MARYIHPFSPSKEVNFLIYPNTDTVTTLQRAKPGCGPSLFPRLHRLRMRAARVTGIRRWCVGRGMRGSDGQLLLLEHAYDLLMLVGYEIKNYRSAQVSNVFYIKQTSCEWYARKSKPAHDERIRTLSHLIFSSAVTAQFVLVAFIRCDHRLNV